MNGNYGDTEFGDDSYESITEVSGGNTSYLEHKWTIDVDGADIGAINMIGGIIDAGGVLKIPGTGGTGTVNLDDGVIEAHSITMDSNGLLDIESGTLIIDGNVVSTINTYVTNGWVKAYGGNGTIETDYNISHSGLTTVTATSNGNTEGVKIYCNALNKEVTVQYDANAALEIRAFNIDISVDNGAKIIAANNFNSDYWVHLGSIDVNQTTGQIVDYGSAICDGNYPGTLAGLGSSGMTVEMASLYVGDANAPSNYGILLKFIVDKSCTVTIKENEIRDGVVLKDCSKIDADTTGCIIN